MSNQLSELNLAEDFEKTLLTEDVSRWVLEKPNSLEVWVRIHSIVKPAEVFQARLLWNLYPDEAPSVKFRDPVTGRLDIKTAWPRARGFRPDSFDICTNWTREGFTLHPEWKNDPALRWNSHGNCLLKVLRIMQSELDNFFEGRFS